MIIAGSCSLESPQQALHLAAALQERGITHIRAAIFKPRTDPETFQGLGWEGLSILDEMRARGLHPVTEVTAPEQVEKLVEHVSVFQVGTRNMYNYELLRELGHTKTPVILKRGMSAYVSEWLKSAEYILRGGNEDVRLCERGIRSFDTLTRNVLDVGAIVYLKTYTPFTVYADPSHATGDRRLVGGAARAALAAGADGLMIEVHEEPDASWTDAKQALSLEMFDALLESIGWNA